MGLFWPTWTIQNQISDSTAPGRVRNPLRMGSPNIFRATRKALRVAGSYFGSEAVRNPGRPAGRVAFPDRKELTSFRNQSYI